jgi:hypothetical protein
MSRSTAAQAILHIGTSLLVSIVTYCLAFLVGQNRNFLVEMGYQLLILLLGGTFYFFFYSVERAAASHGRSAWWWISAGHFLLFFFLWLAVVIVRRTWLEPFTHYSETQLLGGDDERLRIFLLIFTFTREITPFVNAAVCLAFSTYFFRRAWRRSTSSTGSPAPAAAGKGRHGPYWVGCVVHGCRHRFSAVFYVALTVLSLYNLATTFMPFYVSSSWFISTEMCGEKGPNPLYASFILFVYFAMIIAAFVVYHICIRVLSRGDFEHAFHNNWAIFFLTLPITTYVVLPQLFVFGVPFLIATLTQLLCGSFDKFRALYLGLFTSLLLLFWEYISSFIKDLAKALEPAYSVVRALNFCVILVESYMGLISVRIFSTLNNGTCAGTQTGAINPSFADEGLLVLIYMVRACRWVLLQTGLFSYLLKTAARLAAAGFRRICRCGARKRSSAVAPAPSSSPSGELHLQNRLENGSTANHLPDKGEKLESKANDDGVGRQWCQLHYADDTDGPPKPELMPDVGRPSCGIHRQVLATIQREHDLEGRILAEICTTLSVILLLVIQFTLRDCNDPTNFFRAKVCADKEVIDIGLRGFWYAAETAIFSLGFTLCYLPAFLYVRKLNLVRLGCYPNGELRILLRRCMLSSNILLISLSPSHLANRTDLFLAKWLNRLIDTNPASQGVCTGKACHVMEDAAVSKLDESLKRLLPRLLSDVQFGRYFVVFVIVEIWFFANISLQ